MAARRVPSWQLEGAQETLSLVTCLIQLLDDPSFLVPQSTEVRAFEWETSCLIGVNPRNGFAFWQALVNMEGLQPEP